MPKIPEGDFDTSISMSVPTVQRSNKGDLALGSALQQTGNDLEAIANSMGEIRAKSEAYNFVQERKSQDQLELVDFSEKTRKLVNPKTGKIDAYRMDASGNKIQTTLPDGTPLDKDTDYTEIIKRFQEAKRSNAEVDSPNSFARDMYRSSMDHIYQTNSIAALSFQTDTIYKGTLKTLSDTIEIMANDSRTFGQKSPTGGREILAQAEDRVASTFKDIELALDSGIISIQEAENLKRQASSKAVEQYLAGYNNAYLTPSVKYRNKKQSLIDFGLRLQEAASGNIASPMFYNLDANSQAQLNKTLHKYNLDIAFQSGKQSLEAKNGLISTLYREGVTSDNKDKLEAAKNDIKENLKLSMSSEDYIRHVGDMEVAFKASEALKDVATVPASQREAYFNKKMQEADALTAQDYDPDLLNNVDAGLLNSKVKESMKQAYNAYNAKLQKEAEDDPAGYVVKYHPKAKGIYNEFIKEQDPVKKNQLLKALTTETDLLQYTLTETPESKRRSFSKPLTESLVGQISNYAKNFSIPGTREQYDAMIITLGPEFIMKLNSQAEADNLKQHNPSIFSAAYFSSDVSEPTRNMVLNLETKRSEIEKQYKENFSSVENFKESDIDTNLSSKFSEYTQYSSFNLNGMRDNSAINSLFQTGRLFIKNKILEGSTVEDAVEGYETVLKKAFTPVEVGATKILLPASMPSQPVVDFLEAHDGRVKSTQELIKSGKVTYPQWVFHDPIKNTKASPELEMNNKARFEIQVTKSLRYVATPNGLQPVYNQDGTFYYLLDKNGKAFSYSWNDINNDKHTKSSNEKGFLTKLWENIMDSSSTPESSGTLKALQNLESQKQSTKVKSESKLKPTTMVKPNLKTGVTALKESPDATMEAARRIFKEMEERPNQNKVNDVWRND